MVSRGRLTSRSCASRPRAQGTGWRPAQQMAGFATMLDLEYRLSNSRVPRHDPGSEAPPGTDWSSCRVTTMKWRKRTFHCAVLLKKSAPCERQLWPTRGHWSRLSVELVYVVQRTLRPQLTLRHCNRLLPTAFVQKVLAATQAQLHWPRRFLTRGGRRRWRAGIRCAPVRSVRTRR